MKGKMQELVFKVSKSDVTGDYWLDAKCGKKEAGYPPTNSFGLIELIIGIIKNWKLKKRINKASRTFSKFLILLVRLV